MFTTLRLLIMISLTLMVGAIACGSYIYTQWGREDILRDGEQKSLAMARAYSNILWMPYESKLSTALKSGNGLKDNADIKQFAQDSIRFFNGVSFAWVRIYTREGALLLQILPNGQPAYQETAKPKLPVTSVITGGGRHSEWLPVTFQGEEGEVAHSIITLTSGYPGAIEIAHDMGIELENSRKQLIYMVASLLMAFLFFVLILNIALRKSEMIIARQHEENMELAQTAATAQAENMEKSQFLANISHELRTPLNAIIGFSDIIRTEVVTQLDNPKYHDYITDIHSSGVHLLSLINDILDYSKAEAGKLELEVTEVSAGKMVQNCMRLVAPRADQAQVKLLEGLPREPVIMLTDTKKLKQILLNLLSNAVKFTPPEGEVKVTLWHEVPHDMIVFEVRDSGIGIAPKDISRAMAPFGQVDNKLSRKYEGTGLGLPLTKKFVELMGGKFNIESKVNHGTTITFSIPRELKPLTLPEEHAPEDDDA